MSQEEEILNQTVIEDEKPEMTLAEKLREQRAKKRKKNIKRGAIISFFVLFAYLLWYLFKPFPASAEYGICRTFLELTVPYPHTIYVREINVLRNNGGVRLWYSHTDGFGEYRMEPFTCQFETDPETGKITIQQIKMNKVNMGQDRLAHLSHALILFEEKPLILNYPAPLPDSLADLHFEFDMFRRVRINADKYKGP